MTSDDLSQADLPQGEISLRVLAMPADTGPSGHIFGGWVLGRMDLAGSMHATSHTSNRTVTVAVDSMTFHKPIHMGDEVTCYTRVVHVGHTSIALQVETWVRRHHHATPVKVTEGRFTYVAVGEDGRPVEIKQK